MTLQPRIGAPRRVHRRLLLVVLVVSLASVLPAAVATPAAAAAVIPVDCGADPTALVTAFAGASAGDTLAITGTCTGSLDIAKDITLTGSGSAILDAQGQAIRVVTVRAGASATITGLTITGGQGFAGVGIHNLGTVTLTNARVSGNVASLWGGGIYNRYGATLMLEGSAVTGNSAGENAGGIFNDGTVTLTDSSVSGNSGGLGGGGILNSSFGTFHLRSGLVHGNNARFGGGVANNGLLTVGTATIASNRAAYGGGMYLGGGRAIIEQTTIEHNDATADGGGVNNGGGQYSYWMPPVLRNTTIFGNSAGGSGGGVANTGYIGNMTLEHVTIARNRAALSGAGIANPGYSGQVTLRNTVVAAPAQGQNCTGPISDAGYNLDDGTSCGLAAAGSLPNTDAELDPNGLAYNGGPTRTVALLPASPAVDAIPRSINGCSTSFTIDQREISRPQGPACDIGAFEMVPDTTPPVLTLPTIVAADATSPMGASVDYETSVSATDETDGPVPASCTPPSGSTFPIGDTAVECTATDAAGNSSTGAFSVHMKGAEEQLDDLVTLVDSYELETLGNSLHAQLVAAERLLAAGRAGAAENVLQAFVLEVRAQRGKGLTEAQADALEAAALRIIDVIET